MVCFAVGLVLAESVIDGELEAEGFEPGTSLEHLRLDEHGSICQRHERTESPREALPEVDPAPHPIYADVSEVEQEERLVGLRS